jgi:CDP-diacylglycerol--glycerol-3-phosphate 3-phosphatidyltransferase
MTLSHAAQRPSGGLYALKPAFQARLSRLADWLVARRVSPDALTYAAVGCALLGGGLLSVGLRQPGLLWLLWLLVPLIVARLALNALDGMVATRSGHARPWGKVLNEFADRLADLAFLGPLLLVPGVSVWLVVGALCATLLVSYLGILAEAAGAGRQYGGPMGKADRMAWLGLAAALTAASGSLLPLELLPGLLLVGALLTLLARGVHTHAAL